MIAQLLRQTGRAVAIYFSEVLLWLSVAGALEVIAVIGAAALCILTAGFFFENMKKHPFVMVLGGLVALTGTFLMFREVRGMIWPAPVVVAAPAPAPAPGPKPPPTNPQVVLPPAWKLEPNCRSVSLQSTCEATPACFWSWIANKCEKKLVIVVPPVPSPTPAPKPSPQATLPISTCNYLSKAMCATNMACYWSSLFNRCEKLQFGTGATFTPPPLVPAGPSCHGRSELSCRITSGCAWFANTCIIGFSKKL